MRVLLAQMKHETNTFSPVPTDLARFARGEPAPLYGDDAYRAFRATGTALGGFIAAAEAEGRLPEEGEGMRDPDADLDAEGDLEAEDVDLEERG